MNMNPVVIYKQIVGLFKIKREVTKMKLSELSTSEGRMALLLNGITIYTAIQGFLPAPLVAKIAVVSLAIYTIGRALVKCAATLAPMTKTTKDDVIVAEAESILAKVEPKNP